MLHAAANTPKLELLKLARMVADHAASLGVGNAPRRMRPSASHLGAVMADAVLQSGVNYRTVVYPRVQAIIHHYPEACSITGIRCVVKAGRLSEFLRWRHAVKIRRFESLFDYFENCGVVGFDSLDYPLAT